MENIKYELWYFFYKATNKLNLWRLYHGVDEDTGIPYIEQKWFWQDKDGLERLSG